MRVAYLDCFSGISGNMALGALIGLGAEPDRIQAEVEKLGLGGFELKVSDVRRGPIGAKYVEVISGGEQVQEHRAWRDIQGMIEGAPIDPGVKDLSQLVFRRLADAEAKVHQINVETVSFHEVGAADSIVDIVGTCAGLVGLGISRVECSPLPLGRGTIETWHGNLPLPAPATVELLKGMPVYGVVDPFESVTPTGAAIVAALAASSGSMPAMRILGIGYGAGANRATRLPNVLRVVLGEQQESFDADSVCVLETNIDDLNPEVYGYMVGRLSAAGALDVSLAPIQMKKGRPGTLLRVICGEADRERLAGVIFQESSALGVRFTRAERMLLRRREEEVETPYGRVRVKVAGGQEGIRTLHPEYEDCRRLAEAAGVPLREVIEAAVAVARERFGRH